MRPPPAARRREVLRGAFSPLVTGGRAAVLDRSALKTPA
jgi:hypothetical protein